jgi:hypothetical protein
MKASRPTAADPKTLGIESNPANPLWRDATANRNRVRPEGFGLMQLGQEIARDQHRAQRLVVDAFKSRPLTELVAVNGPASRDSSYSPATTKRQPKPVFPTVPRGGRGHWEDEPSHISFGVDVIKGPISELAARNQSERPHIPQKFAQPHSDGCNTSSVSVEEPCHLYRITNGIEPNEVSELSQPDEPTP